MKEGGIMAGEKESNCVRGGRQKGSVKMKLLQGREMRDDLSGMVPTTRITVPEE